MFRITSKAKRGGIWNGTEAVKEFETDSAALADQLKARGCTVEEIEEAPNKSKEQPKKGKE